MITLWGARILFVVEFICASSFDLINPRCDARSNVRELFWGTLEKGRDTMQATAPPSMHFKDVSNNALTRLDE